MSLLLTLVCVRDGHTLDLVAVVADGVLFFIADDDHELVGAEFDELFETVCENQLSRSLDHSFRLIFRKETELGPFANC